MHNFSTFFLRQMIVKYESGILRQAGTCPNSICQRLNTLLVQLIILIFNEDTCITIGLFECCA